MAKVLDFEEIIDASKNFKLEVEKRHGGGVDVHIDSEEQIVQNLFEKIFSRPKVRVKGQVIPLEKEEPSTKNRTSEEKPKTEPLTLHHVEQKQIAKLHGQIFSEEGELSPLHRDTNFPHSKIKSQDNVYQILSQFETVLEEHDFSAVTRNKFFSYVKQTLTLEDLMDSAKLPFLFQVFLQEELKFFSLEENLPEKSPEKFLEKRTEKRTKFPQSESSLNQQIKKQKTPQRIISLVGPTGVGKTLSILKLATMFLREKDKRQENFVLRIAYLDNFQIAGIERMNKIAGLLSVDCTCITSETEMRAYSKRPRAKTNDPKDRDLMLLIDTVGHRVRDESGEKDRTQSCLSAIKSQNETVLVLGATMSYKNLHAVCDEFSSYNYKAVVITKIDETESIGAILSVCMERSIPIAYLGCSSAPNGYLEKASFDKLFVHLSGIFQ